MKTKKLIATTITLLTILVLAATIKSVYDWRRGASGRPASISIDASSPQAEINPQLWQNFAQGGEEQKDMIGPIVNQVRLLQPKLIRIDHIFDFYEVFQSDGNFNFSRLDQAVHSILKTGAVPMFSLSYIPPQLATDGQITSPPRDWLQWERLITATIERYSGKNGLNIYNVYYEVYNEPDLFGGWHYGKDPNYLTLYYHAAKGAQRARNTNPFKIGGPATTGFYPNWIKALIHSCRRNNLPLDFLSWHRYSPNPQDYDHDFEKITAILTDYPRYQGVERLITEFGPGPERSSWYENRVSATQAIAVTTHLLNRVHRIFAFELKDGPSASTTQWGMLTHENNGARPKPRWNAYLFLNKLVGKRLPLEGNGSWVSGVASKNNKEIRVLLVNYDPRQKHSEYVPIRIHNLAPGRYRLSLDYLFGKDSQLIKETKKDTLFHQVYLSANEAVFITLNPLF